MQTQQIVIELKDGVSEAGLFEFYNAIIDQCEKHEMPSEVMIVIHGLISGEPHSQCSVYKKDGKMYSEDAIGSS